MASESSAAELHAALSSAAELADRERAEVPFSSCALSLSLYPRVSAFMPRVSSFYVLSFPPSLFNSRHVPLSCFFLKASAAIASANTRCDGLARELAAALADLAQAKAGAAAASEAHGTASSRERESAESLRGDLAAAEGRVAALESELAAAAASASHAQRESAHAAQLAKDAAQATKEALAAQKSTEEAAAHRVKTAEADSLAAISSAAMRVADAHAVAESAASKAAAAEADASRARSEALVAIQQFDIASARAVELESALAGERVVLQKVREAALGETSGLRVAHADAYARLEQVRPPFFC